MFGKKNIEFLEPGQEPMTLNRDKRGARGHRKSSMETSDVVKIGLSVVVLALVGWWVAGWLFGGDDEAQAAPAPGPSEPVIATVPPLEMPAPQIEPETVLEPSQIAATATFQAALSRPAAVNPATSPTFVGVVTFEDGCPISNIGFTTSGYNGTPYYLYVQEPFEQSPLYQVIQVRGFIQEFEECRQPVIMVQQLTFFGIEGTPAPVSAITNTQLITGVDLSTWGLKTTPIAAVQPGQTMPDLGGYKPTATATITAATVLTAPTATPYPTYTPYPTTAPYIPPARHIPPPSDDDDEPDPTATPSPTPTATATPTPVQQANIDGPVIAVAGCQATNLAIKTGQDRHTYLVFDGAALPETGSPTDYRAMAIGVLDTACNGQAIKARLVTWYKPDPTPEPTNTPTTEPTAEPTAEPTTEPTAEPTEEPTAEPTEEPTTEPTAEPTAESQKNATSDNGGKPK